MKKLILSFICNLWNIGIMFPLCFIVRMDAKEFTKQSNAKLIVMNSYRKKGKDIESKSQYGQELFIYEQVFNKKPNGVFVEVGGNDPVLLNNTYALEKMGWSGIAFEPMDYLREKWEIERIAKCYPYVIGDKEGWVEFNEVIEHDLESASPKRKKTGHGQGVMSSVAGYGRSLDKLGSFAINTVKKQMCTLENILHELEMQHIDVMFVDVEGFEFAVLSGIDFSKVSIGCICVEAPILCKETSRLRAILVKKGYALIAHIGGDDIFLRNDLVLQKNI